MPQGSILGPLLFIVYINNLPNYFSKTTCNFTLYADDTTALLKRKTFSELKFTLDDTIAKINEWFENHGLKLNEDKTNILQFKLRNNVTDPTISNTKIVKFLGLNLDSKLSWSDHIHFLSKKLSSTRYAIS